MNELMDGWMNEWMSEWVNEWRKEWMNEWMSKWAGKIEWDEWKKQEEVMASERKWLIYEFCKDLLVILDASFYSFFSFC